MIKPLNQEQSQPSDEQPSLRKYYFKLGKYCSNIIDL